MAILKKATAVGVNEKLTTMNSKYAMTIDESSETKAPAHGGPGRPAPTKASRYLTRPRRSLRDACNDITREHGIAAAPCAACRVRNLCAASKPDAAALAEPKPRPRG